MWQPSFSFSVLSCLVHGPAVSLPHNAVFAGGAELVQVRTVSQEDEFTADRAVGQELFQNRGLADIQGGISGKHVLPLKRVGLGEL